MIGALSTPPRAPSAAARAKLARITPRVEMPISRAASGLIAVARIALPYKVRLKNQPSAKTAKALPANTHRLCGSTVALPSAIGSAPENAGRAWMRLSHSTCARPRRNSATPIVMMISVTTSALPPDWAGSRARRCTSTPTITAPSIASGTAAHSGSPRPTRETAPMPPIITNSPWAKLIAWLAL